MRLLLKISGGTFYQIQTDIYLTNRFHVAVRLFSNRSEMTSKCGKNKEVAHEEPSTAILKRRNGESGNGNGNGNGERGTGNGEREIFKTGYL